MKLFNRILKPSIFIGLLAVFTHSFASSNNAEYTPREQAEYDYAYALGVQATVYGWAPVMMDVALELQTGVEFPMDNGQAPLNQLGPITRLWDYRDKSYATPNNDTLYLQMWADLAEEPIVLSVPVIKDRYWMAQIIDMYTESVVDLANSTVGSQGGDFVLAMEGFDGAIPDDMQVYYSPTRYIWMAGRLGVKSSADEHEAREIQKQFRVSPLSSFSSAPAQPEPRTAGSAPTVQFPTGLDWFDRLDKVLGENPLAADKALVDTFTFIGIGNGGTESLSQVRQAALLEAFSDGAHIVRDTAMFTGVPVNGWNWEYDAGRYGTDYLLRAAVNMNSVGLNSPERAMYPKRYVDSEGELLNGNNSYTLTFPKNMPVNEELGGFWSLTMYDAEDRFMVQNEINRYKIGSATEGLIRNADGSLTISISHARPSDPMQLANWLPAPDGGFMLQVRLYEPSKEVVEGHFALPEMHKLN